MGWGGGAVYQVIVVCRALLKLSVSALSARLFIFLFFFIFIKLTFEILLSVYNYKYNCQDPQEDEGGRTVSKEEEECV